MARAIGSTIRAPTHSQEARCVQQQERRRQRFMWNKDEVDGKIEQVKGRAKQEHGAFAAERRAQLLDLLDVDDGRAMDADESLRVELRFQAVHRFAKQVRLLPDMEAHVVAGRFAQLSSELAGMA